MKKATIILMLLMFSMIDLKAQCWGEVSNGEFHTFAIKKDRTLWAWGLNDYGQLGLGDTINRITPIQVGNSKNWKSVVGGRGHSLAIKTDGTLWAWGWNLFGQVGDSTKIDTHIPIQIGQDTDWKQVCAGWCHSVAIKKNGTLWAWGVNSYGELGDSTQVNKNFPTHIGIDSDWNIISTGISYTVAIKINKTLWAWGSNSYGQLGDGSNIDKLIPNMVGKSSDWETVSAKEHTIAIKTNGTLWGCGENIQYQLGDSTGGYLHNLVKIGLDSNWFKVFAGRGNSIAIKKDSSLWIWGYNIFGSLGDSSTYKKTPTHIAKGEKWSNIRAGSWFSIGVKIDTSLWIWGINHYGTIGDGTTIDKYKPTEIACQAALPLHFLKLSIINNNNINHISWETDNENNVSKYLIEVSKTSKDFETIGYQPANDKNKYTFVHSIRNDLNNSNVIYYRIVGINYDGSEISSEIKSIINHSLSSVMIYPNPSKDLITVEGVMIKQLIISDMEGRIVRQFDNQTIQTIDISKLLKGLYILKIIGKDNSVSIEKFMKK